MKVRVKRTGLLGLVMHYKGTEINIEREQYRTWMTPLDEESREVAEEWKKNSKSLRVDRAKLELARMQARVAELEAERGLRSSPGITGDVL